MVVGHGCLAAALLKIALKSVSTVLRLGLKFFPSRLHEVAQQQSCTFALMLLTGWDHFMKW